MTDPTLPPSAAGSGDSVGQAWPGSMIDEIDLAVWRLDLHHRVVELNLLARRLFGLSDAAPNDDLDWCAVFHPDDLERAKATVLESIGTLEEMACDLRVRGADQSDFRWFRFGVRAIEVSGRGHVGWTCIGRDIHGLFLARSALRQSERLLNVAFGSSQMGSWRLAMGDDRVVVDEYVRELWGLSDPSGSPLLSTLLQHVHPDDRERFVQSAERAWRSGSLDGLFRIKRSDGATRWQRVIGVLATDPGSDRPIIIGVGADVTERQHVRQELRLASQRLKVALDVSKVLLYTMDRQLRYTWIHSPNLNLDDQIGRRDDEVREHREDAMALMAFKQSVLERGVGDQRSFALTIAGETLYVDVSVEPLRNDDGRIEGLAGAAFNVTRRRRAEIALREAGQRKDEFLAVLAHELRNPLAPIRNALALLRQEDSAEVRGRVLPIIERQIRQMGRLIDDLLDVSRLDSGRMTLRREPVDMTELLHYIGRAQSLALESRQQPLEVTLPQMPLFVEGDRGRIGQILVNLISNASKFTPQGGRIWLEAQAEASEFVIRVRDSGIGIAADHLSLIFEKFAQLPRGEGALIDGLGIGLHLVRELVAMHGGSIEAHSKGLGLGSEFVVRLPLSQDPNSQAPVSVPGSATEAAMAPEAASLLILVVDDNPDITETMSLLLQAWGYRTLSATDAAVGLSLVGSERPDIVLLDLGMPVMDGFELARCIRDLPGGKDIRLIAVSGWGQHYDVVRSRNAGIDEHLLKPVDPLRLREVLERGRPL